MKRLFTIFAAASLSIGAWAQGQPVDLGLSVKWASCNVGANEPYETGTLFAWGETAPKTIYSFSNYRWGSSNGWGGWSGLTKYNTKSERGPIDGKQILDDTDDAATVQCGPKWRTPSWPEREELLTKCRWEWKTVHGVPGYEVTSSSNGNSIFLPATGYMSEGNYYRAKEMGFYWTSALASDYPTLAYYLSFSETEILPNVHSSSYDMSRPQNQESRHYGFAVRPVLNERY